tara:strand:+ start:1638 stop:1886 length:249 start_codon:yes stop_codon:yes gene_type:complete
MSVVAGAINIGRRSLAELANTEADRTAIIETNYCPIDGDGRHADHQTGRKLAQRGFSVLYLSKIEPEHRKYASTVIQGDKAA